MADDVAFEKLLQFSETLGEYNNELQVTLTEVMRLMPRSVLCMPVMMYIKEQQKKFQAFADRIKEISKS